MKKVKVLFTGGGTGGHVYPNVAILERIAKTWTDAEFTYIGTKQGAERKIIENLTFPVLFKTVISRGLPGKMRSLETLFALICIFAGAVQSFFLMRKIRPDIVIATGGYVSAPVLLSAIILKKKIFIHEQNAVPGRLNRIMGRFATKTGVSFRSTLDFFPKKSTVYTGYPLRKSILRTGQKDELKKKLGIPLTNKVVFAFGGSRGAKNINEAVCSIVPDILKQENITLILSTGRGYSSSYKAYESSMRKLREKGIHGSIEGRFIVREYFDNIDEIYAVSDLVICRAGAGTVTEISKLAVPSLLIPKIDLPGDHQILNALEIAGTGGGRVLYESIEQKRGVRRTVIPPEVLFNNITEILSSEEILEKMRSSLTRNISSSDPADKIFEIISHMITPSVKQEKYEEIKLLYLNDEKGEKSYDLIFESTILGSAFLADYEINGTDEKFLIKINNYNNGKGIILKCIKGKVSVNGNTVKNWVEIKEGDTISLPDRDLVLNAYFEKVEKKQKSKSTYMKVLGSSAGIMCSRLGGFFRELVIASFFGAGRIADIFTIGLTVSNFMRRIVAENAVENAFLPVFSRLFNRRTREQTWRSASSIINAIILLSLIFTVIGIIFTPFIIKTFFPGLVAKGMLTDTVNMTRLMFPYLILITIASVLAVFLKAFDAFGTAESAALLFSAGTIAGVVLFHESMGMYSLALGVLIGGILQIAGLVPFTYRILKRPYAGFKYYPVLRLKSVESRKFFSQLTPISADVILTKTSEIVDKFLASGLATGSIAYLHFSITLFRLPFAVISQAINSVLLKEFSDQLSLFDKDKTRKLFSEGVKINLFLLVPISLLMVILAEPLVALIFQRGAFTSSMTMNTALALKFYAIGLGAWGIHSLTSRLFAARLDIRTSMVLNFFMLLTNVVLSFYFIHIGMEFKGLALATSISYILFAVLRLFVLKVRFKNESIVVDLKDIGISFLKTSFASLMMMIAVWESKYIFARLMFGSLFLNNLFLFVSMVFIGVSAYMLTSIILKNTEVMLFRKKSRAGRERNIPVSMLSPFRFLERVSASPEKYRENFSYKVNIYISSSAWEVRNAGIKLIGVFKDRSKREYLTDLIRNRRENPFMRRNAVISLSKLDLWDKEIKDLMHHILKDSYYEVRSAGFRFLAATNLTIDEYFEFRPMVKKTLKKRGFEEKIAALKLIAESGTADDLEILKGFFLTGNSLIRENLMLLIKRFYQRDIISSDKVKEAVHNVLITSNNFAPDFNLKKIIKDILKEIE